MELVDNKLNFKSGEKLGLVLEGGGVKGAYQLGALQALFDAGLEFQGVTGTSIGALNGALLVQGGYPEMCRFWQDVRASKIFDIDDDMVEKATKYEIDKEWMSKASLIARNLVQIVNDSSDKMRSYFASFYDEEKLRKSPMDFGLVTFSISDMEPVERFKEEIPKGRLIDFIIASASFPVYRFQRIDGERYIDGGVWDNMPVNLLAKKGYKNIVVIRTKGKPPKRKLLFDDLNLVVITPSEDLGKAVVFTEERIERNKKLGYYDATRVIKGYKGVKFYILPYDSAEIASYLSSAPTKLYSDLAFKLSGKRTRDKVAALEIIAHTIKEELKLKTDDTAEIFLTMFEVFGALFSLEKFELYSALDFIKTVFCKGKDFGATQEQFMLGTRALRNLRLREIFFSLAKYFG